MKQTKQTRLLVMLIAALAAVFTAAAKDNPEDYRVIVTRADGSTFEGYVASALRNHMRPKISDVKISDTYGGEAVKYSSEEVVAIEFPPTEDNDKRVVYHAVKAQGKMPTLFNKNPKPNKNPIFLRLVYDGEKVKGYAMPVTDSTYVPSMTIVNYTWMYFYLPVGEEVARAYWSDTDDIVPQMKKVMKFYMREFPAIQDMIDRDEIKPGDFRGNPAMILPIIDSVL